MPKQGARSNCCGCPRYGLAGPSGAINTRVLGKRLKGADGNDRSDHRGLEVTTQVEHSSNGDSAQPFRARARSRLTVRKRKTGVQSASAVDVLVAGGRDVAANVDARHTGSEKPTPLNSLSTLPI